MRLATQFFPVLLATTAGGAFDCSRRTRAFSRSRGISAAPIVILLASAFVFGDSSAVA